MKLSAEQLTTTCGDPYWSHNSGGEHSLKHTGDIDEINAIRFSLGLNDIDRYDLNNLMYDNGVVCVRQLLDDGSAGELVAYVIAERKRETVQVIDIYEPKKEGVLSHYLIGKLLTNVAIDLKPNGLTVVPYESQLHLQNQTIKLPGIHITGSQAVLGDNFEKFAETPVPNKWSGIRSLVRFDESAHQVYLNGQPTEIIEEQGFKYKIPDSSAVFDHILFAAMAVINE
mgnify:CR=1 FL=1